MAGLDKCRYFYRKLSMELPKTCFIGDKEQDWAYLRSIIHNELSSLDLEHKFRHGIFDCILHEGFVKQTNRDYKQLAKAFEVLEVYCRLLKSYPWKTEYHTLKTYGGFFRTYVYSALPSCMEILRIIGYTPMRSAQAEYQAKPTVLKLNSMPNIALLETIGFDCLAASVECEIRSENVSNALKYLQLDELRDVRMPNKSRIRSKPLILADKDTRKISSLPKELEPFPSIDQSHTSRLLHSIAKTRRHHSEKLYTYQNKRKQFLKSVDNNNYFRLRNVGYNPEKNDFTTVDDDPTN